ncbi:MAG TPA: hypothetical protein VK308_14810 [Pyrinomonadaceae bacterium]|nr:hypothetical protein [Pyrinomonadaceae bacterium]
MENNGTHNKSMDVRAKQRLSYHAALFPLACVWLVSPHVISIVGRFLLKQET